MLSLSRRRKAAQVAWDLPEGSIDAAEWPTIQELSRHFVLMARAKTLDDLGGKDAGLNLVEDWVRGERGARPLDTPQ